MMHDRIVPETNTILLTKVTPINSINIKFKTYCILYFLRRGSAAFNRFSEVTCPCPKIKIL